MSILSNALTNAAGLAKSVTDQAPRYCRSRGCKLLNHHDGPHTVPAPVQACHAKDCKQPLGHDNGEHLVEVRRSDRFGRYAVTAKRKPKALPAAQSRRVAPNKAARQRALRALRPGVTPEHVERAA